MVLTTKTLQAALLVAMEKPSYWLLSLLVHLTLEY